MSTRPTPLPTAQAVHTTAVTAQIANAQVARSAPANTGTYAQRAARGFKTNNQRILHILVQLPDTGTSLTWSLYLFDAASGLWSLDTRLGTAGVVTLVESGTDNPSLSLVDIGGADRVDIALASFSGVFTAGANVWLSDWSDQAEPPR